MPLIALCDGLGGCCILAPHLELTLHGSPHPALRARYVGLGEPDVQSGARGAGKGLTGEYIAGVRASAYEGDLGIQRPLAGNEAFTSLPVGAADTL